MNKLGPDERVGHCYLTNTLSLLACALSVIGVLLVTEVIRPFHNLTIDGPLALILWGLGTVAGLVCLSLRGRSLVFCLVSLGSNVLPLLSALILWWLLRNSNFTWH